MFRFMVVAMVFALTHMASGTVAAAAPLLCPLVLGPETIIEVTPTIVGTEGDGVIRGTDGPDVIS